MAVGFTDFNDETEPILDPSIGEIIVFRAMWSNTTYRAKKIETH